MTEEPYDDSLISQADCETLWRQVLLLAVNDAVRGVGSPGHSALTRARLTQEARDYITKPNRDFNEVCSLAGMAPEAVRERVVKQLATAPTSEEVIEAKAIKAPKRPAAPKPARPPRRIGLPHIVAGRSLTRRQWAEELGITYNNMNQAVRKYGSVEAAVIRRLGASQ